MNKIVAIHKDKERILLKDNVLVKTKYELNLVENRLYNLLMYKLQKEGNDYRCSISQKEIKEVVKHKELNTFKGIQLVLDKLSSKKILIEEKKNNGKNSIWHNYKLIDGYSYDDEFKIFTVKATAEIYDLLKQKFQNGGYTPNNINLFLTLKNYYAQRLYDLLRLWSGTKTKINYSFNELKMYFMLEDAYPEYGNFKRRVITPAIKELNNTGYFEIDIKENKIGRKVESIDFIVKDLDKRIYFNKKENNNIINLDSTEYIAVDSEPSFEKKNKVDDFYIPNKKLFTAKTLLDFKNDFNGYDFKNPEYKKLLQDSILTTLEKDNEEKIKAKSYKYFKKVLENKIGSLVSSQKETDEIFKKTKFHNFTENFEQYSSDELDDIIERAQKEKYNI